MPAKEEKSLNSIEKAVSWLLTTAAPLGGVWDSVVMVMGTDRMSGRKGSRNKRRDDDVDNMVPIRDKTL